MSPEGDAHPAQHGQPGSSRPPDTAWDHPDGPAVLITQTEREYSFVFSAPSDSRQSVTVQRAVDAGARTHAPDGQAVISDAEVAFGAWPDIVESGGYRFSAAAAQ
ncbi:hypothetical protein ACIF83_18930 [Streptomyces sp. NPDC085866]|uniref:hypothetical protein n=1 Tax=Streptomyces sp. NPDC085866 TaxID=3365736 RepID=UPI0037D4092A